MCCQNQVVTKEFKVCKKIVESFECVPTRSSKILFSYYHLSRRMKDGGQSSCTHMRDSAQGHKSTWGHATMVHACQIRLLKAGRQAGINLCWLFMTAPAQPLFFGGWLLHPESLLGTSAHFLWHARRVRSYLGSVLGAPLLYQLPGLHPSVPGHCLGAYTKCRCWSPLLSPFLSWARGQWSIRLARARKLLTSASLMRLSAAKAARAPWMAVLRRLRISAFSSVVKHGRGRLCSMRPSR